MTRRFNQHPFESFLVLGNLGKIRFEKKMVKASHSFLESQIKHFEFTEEEYSAKFLEDVLEEEEDESGEPKELQTVNYHNVIRIANIELIEFFKRHLQLHQTMAATLPKLK